MLKGYIIEKYSNMIGAYTCNRLVEEAAKRGVDLGIVGIADVVAGSERTEEGKEQCVLYHHGKKLEQCDFVLNRYKYGHIKDEIGTLAKHTYNDTEAFNIYINKYIVTL